jgi:hypothetical protein
MEIKDSKMMLEIMRLIGWQSAPTVDKKRIKTNFHNMEIVLDEVQELGEFIEAEKIATEADPEARKKIQEELLEFLYTLGVAKDDVVVDGKYDIMLYEKMKENLQIAFKALSGDFGLELSAKAKKRLSTPSISSKTISLNQIKKKYL